MRWNERKESSTVKKLVMMLTLMMVTGAAVAQETRKQTGKHKWEICINGVNLRGEPCRGDTWGHWNKPKQITATGQDALNLIQRGEILSSQVSCNGQSLFVVKYRGSFAPTQGKIFNCEVTNNARRFHCVSWTAGQNW